MRTVISPIVRNGRVTFPRDAAGNVLVDKAFLSVLEPTPCRGGCGRTLEVGEMVVAYLAMPENRMVLGCPECITAFSAERAAVKARLGSLLGTPLWVVGEEPADTARAN